MWCTASLSPRTASRAGDCLPESAGPVMLMYRRTDKIGAGSVTAAPSLVTLFWVFRSGYALLLWTGGAGAVIVVAAVGSVTL